MYLHRLWSGKDSSLATKPIVFAPERKSFMTKLSISIHPCANPSQTSLSIPNFQDRPI